MNRIIKFRVWDKKEKAFFIPIDEPKSFIRCTQFSIFKDVDFICEQFTGLLDRKGREIYEGDIVIHFEKIGIVQFNDGGFSLVNKNNEYLGYEEEFTIGNCKIIGNIHENPEF